MGIVANRCRVVVYNDKNWLGVIRITFLHHKIKLFSCLFHFSCTFICLVLFIYHEVVPSWFHTSTKKDETLN